LIYEVVWLESAQRELTALWKAADDATKAVITRALDSAIDRLTIAPYSQSEERTSFTARVLFELPLRIEFRMERFDGSLVVTHVRLIRKRRE
jgi:hypothetical protein